MFCKCFLPPSSGQTSTKLHGTVPAGCHLAVRILLHYLTQKHKVLGKSLLILKFKGAKDRGVDGRMGSEWILGRLAGGGE
jgi:hypothetical protein